MKDLLLENQSVLVTGSSRGIGLAIAHGMHEAGAEVVFHGNRNAPDHIPENCVFLTEDLLSEGGSQRLLQKALEAKPDLSLLVCNAGSFFDVPFLEMDAERWQKTVDLNMKAVYFLCQAFAREMVARKREAAIVLVSSTNGFQAEDNATAYDTSKGGLVMMTRSMAVSLASYGIRVNSLAPGLIRTPLTKWIDERPEEKAHYEKKILLGRIGEMDDCAGPAVFLCSQAARYITGQVLVVDGGITVAQIGRK